MHTILEDMRTRVHQKVLSWSDNTDGATGYQRGHLETP